jgi:hypothetical protein
MKLFLILILISLTQLVYAQENDAVKYWWYRNRLINNFLKIGPYQGESIPASQRNINFMDMQWGDATCELGTYIGVLATEYRLLKESGANTFQTERELFFAMNAFNRLDFMADRYWNNYSTSGGSLNGFFVRDDVPGDFLGRYNPGLDPQDKRQSVTCYEPCTYIDDFTGELVDNTVHFNNLNIVPSFPPQLRTNFYSPYNTKLKVVSAYCGDDNDVKNDVFQHYRETNKGCDNDPEFVIEDSYPTEPTIDQIISLLQGLILVRKCVDMDAEFSGHSFWDGSTKFNLEAGLIIDRLMTHLKDNQYIVWNPILDQPIFGSVCCEPANETPQEEAFSGKCGSNGTVMSYGFAEAGGVAQLLSPNGYSIANNNQILTAFMGDHVSVSETYQNETSNANFFLAWQNFSNPLAFTIFYRDFPKIAILAAMGNSFWFQIGPNPLFPLFLLYTNVTREFLISRSILQKFEYIPMFYDVLHNSVNGSCNFNYGSSLENRFNELIASASCYGPYCLECLDGYCDKSYLDENNYLHYNYSVDINPNNPLPSSPAGGFYWDSQEWSRTSRWGMGRSNEIVAFDSNDKPYMNTQGEFNGLDYMLFYNLYLLTHESIRENSFYRNMINSEITRNVPFFVSEPVSREVGAQSNNSKWLCYGFDDLKLKCHLSPDGYVRFTALNTIDIVPDEFSADLGAEYDIISGYKGYDCGNWNGIEYRESDEELDSNIQSNLDNNLYGMHSNGDSKNKYSIVPNPNNGHFEILFDLEYISNYQILTVMGQKIDFGVINPDINIRKVDITYLPKGIYILQLQTIDGIKAERIVYQ